MADRTDGYGSDGLGPGDSGDPNDPYSSNYDFNDPRFDPNHPANPSRDDLGVYGAPGAAPYDEDVETRSRGKKSWRERIFSNQTARYVATVSKAKRTGRMGAMAAD